MSHALHPLPSRLTALLVKAKHRGVAARLESWMSRRSPYHFLHEWLDAKDNLEARIALGKEACEIIESENINRFDE